MNVNAWMNGWMNVNDRVWVKLVGVSEDTAATIAIFDKPGQLDPKCAGYQCLWQSHACLCRSVWMMEGHKNQTLDVQVHVSLGRSGTGPARCERWRFWRESIGCAWLSACVSINWQVVDSISKKKSPVQDLLATLRAIWCAKWFIFPQMDNCWIKQMIEAAKNFMLPKLAPVQKLANFSDGGIAWINAKHLKVMCWKTIAR